MIRREDKRLEDVMLRLRHSSIQTIDQVYDHLRRRLRLRLFGRRRVEQHEASVVAKVGAVGIP